MIASEYWNALSPRQRIGLTLGAAMIVLLAITAGVWLLRDPYVPLASAVDAERLGQIAKELEAAKLDYRIADTGDELAVPRSQLSKARAAVSGGPDEAPPSVGLELFKETDFSSTDFAQRINYQRALQGELTRTIQTIAGVRKARVHVILPDGGLFKRNGAKPTAAVSVALQPGNVLTQTQVRGIQRLIAASVPEIKIDDVVVLDESGASLTRASAQGEGDLSSAQLDLKRQADQYLESKLSRLLQELLPQGTASLSVDTTLDEKQLRVTTEEPIAARGGKSANHAAGVLIKERQSQRGHVAGLLQTDGYESGADSTDWEYEYKVGNRVEQTLSAPGSIKRVSVAVALQGAPTELTVAAIEDLVAHAIGIDRARGDSVAVLLLPGLDVSIPNPATPGSSEIISPDFADIETNAYTGARSSTLYGWGAVLTVALVVMVALIFGWMQLRPAPVREVDVDAVAAKVREWLNEGGNGGRA